MAGKTALLLIADESTNLELATALKNLGIETICLAPKGNLPISTPRIACDYVFVDEDSRWRQEHLSFVDQILQSSQAIKVALLSKNSAYPDPTPVSDAYLSLPIDLRALRAIVSQRSQTEAALKQSEQKYRVLFNAMREGMVLHEIIVNEKGEPIDFRYLDVNSVFERMTGLNREDLIGQLLSQTPRWYDNDWPVDYLKVARSGKPYRVEIFIPELDRHFDIVAFRPQAGQCAAIISDITVRIVHEQEIEGLAKHSSALRSAETSSEIIQETLSQINELIKNDRSLLALANARIDKYIVQGATGLWSGLHNKGLPPGDSIAHTLLTSGDILFRDDLSEETGSILAQAPSINVSFLGVPLIVQGESIGFLALARDTAFTTAEIYTITAIAENTASSIRRSILLEQTRLYAEQMKTVSEIGRSLVEILDLPALYSRLCTAVDDLLEGPDSVILWLWDSKNELVPGFALQEHKPVYLGSAQSMPFIAPSDQAFTAIIQNHIPYVKDPASAGSEEKAEILVPIFSKGKDLGALFIQRSPASRFDDADSKLLSLVAHLGAIAIENARLLEATNLSVKRLTALHSIDTAVASSLDLQLTLNVILDQTIVLLGLDAADILLFDPATQEMEFAYGRGFLNQSAIRLLRRFGSKFNPHALTSGQTFNLEHIEENILSNGFERALKNEGIWTYTLIPLVAKGQMKGMLEIYQRKPVEIDSEWQDFLETLAGQAAMAIDNASLFNDLQRSNLELKMAYDTTLEGWSYALDLRDKETEGHTKRVTSLTLKLAREMGVSEEELVHFRRGALLHDIGKLGIRDDILHKSGPLTSEERLMMNQHPVYAYDMLSQIEFLGPAVEIPYYHHEKWDGTGYPNGLKGDQIPLSARIFAVVDVWDSLISDRPYRKAKPKEEVIKYIQEMSGSHFDPSVVSVFLGKRIWAEEATEYGYSF